MSEDKPKHFSSIREWRSWLRENHKDEEALWVILQKKASTKPGIRYEDAVLEAVAHGWIDGKMKSLNEYEFIQRFSPHKSNSIWSQSNRERAERLISESNMTPAGSKTVEEAKKNGRWDKAYSSIRGAAAVPDDLACALKKNMIAQKNFEFFPPSTRFMYIYWINEAKRQETRERRIYTVVNRSENNMRPGIDLRISKK
ncbi:MAG: YdeI/OmpD-associated family protein [Candidatus Bathyarchaeota archaeon]|nr:YdeI/OmpD-associated family protein [Candidatus Bathyarchaeota archaeon]